MLVSRTNGRFHLLALVALLFLGGGAQAAQPLTSLPLEAQGDNHWLLPAGEP
ncbi:MAG TPA: copper-binding protein, partial [Pseudomonas sp.]|nr:copper-binding protein [Pseudomonas sp.]